MRKVDRITSLLLTTELSFPEVARRTGSTRQYVHYVAKNLGVSPKDRTEGYLKYYSTQQVRELWDEGLTAGEIATELNCSIGTVTNKLRELGIPAEDSWKRMGERTHEIYLLGSQVLSKQQGG